MPSLAPGKPPAVPLRGELSYGLEVARLIAPRVLAAILDEEGERWTG